MSQDWIRNEWIHTRGAWTQGGHSMRDRPESERSMRALIRAWDKHQWFESDGFILGLPPDPTNQYLIVFHRKE